MLGDLFDNIDQFRYVLGEVIVEKKLWNYKDVQWA